jgi:outer membrane biosynthesis protein TonB
MRTRKTARRLSPAPVPLATSLVALALTASLPAWSQTPTKAVAAKSDAATTAASMERAQRLADNPLRMILEASRVRRRAEADPGPEAAEASAPRRTAARTEVPAPTSLATAAPPPRAEPTPAAPAAASGTDPQPALVTLAADAALAQPLAAQAPALEVEVAPQAALPLNMTPGPLPSPEMAALLVQPKLVSMTPPDFPQRVLDQVGRIGTVLAELTIRPDGSVAEVNVLPPSPRALQRSISDALMQWRYEPLPAQRRHRVELVFDGER